jgi:hypothetical protein
MVKLLILLGLIVAVIFCLCTTLLAYTFPALDITVIEMQNVKQLS